MKRKWLFSLVIGALVVGGILMAAGTRASDNDLQAVLDAVAAREAAVDSFVYEWESTVRAKQGGHDPQAAGFARASGEEIALPAPAEDTELQEWRRVVVNSDEIRYERHDMVWNVLEGEFQPMEKSHSYPLEGELGAGSLPDEAQFLREFDLAPVLVAHRLLHPVLWHADLDDLVLVESTEYRGHPCIVLDYVWPVPSQKALLDRYWLAEDMDYAVLRYQCRCGGELVGDIEMNYVPDEKIGWRLNSWQIMENLVIEESDNTVTSVRIN